MVDLVLVSPLIIFFRSTFFPAITLLCLHSKIFSATHSAEELVLCFERGGCQEFDSDDEEELALDIIDFSKPSIQDSTFSTLNQNEIDEEGEIANNLPEGDNIQLLAFQESDLSDFSMISTDPHLSDTIGKGLIEICSFKILDVCLFVGNDHSHILSKKYSLSSLPQPSPTSLPESSRFVMEFIIDIFFVSN